MGKWVNHPHISINGESLQAKLWSKKKHLLNLTITNDFFIITKIVFDVMVV